MRRTLRDDSTTTSKQRRAAARMVQLGVTSGQARRFAGDTLFRGILFEESGW